jgi:uncharacterized protein
MNGALLSLVFLGIGLIIGWLAQRSRMCFVAGLRDWIMVRDTELLTGLFSFLATVWVLTSVFSVLGLLHQGAPELGGALTAGTPAASAGAPLGAATPHAAPSFVFLRVGSAVRAPVASLVNNFFIASLVGGFLIGVLSVVAGGCVMRQHVLCAQGDGNALFYLVGFYGAVVAYYLVLGRFFDWVYR